MNTKQLQYNTVTFKELRTNLVFFSFIGFPRGNHVNKIFPIFFGGNKYSIVMLALKHYIY